MNFFFPFSWLHAISAALPARSVRERPAVNAGKHCPCAAREAAQGALRTRKRVSVAIVSVLVSSPPYMFADLYSSTVQM